MIRIFQKTVKMSEQKFNISENLDDVQAVLILDMVNVVVPGCDARQDLDLGVLEVGELHPAGPDYDVQLSRLCFNFSE